MTTITTLEGFDLQEQMRKLDHDYKTMMMKYCGPGIYKIDDISDEICVIMNRLGFIPTCRTIKRKKIKKDNSQVLPSYFWVNKSENLMMYHDLVLDELWMALYIFMCLSEEEIKINMAKPMYG